jgi:hypothetical protein
VGVMQVTVPIRDGYNFGVGVDFITGATMSKVVDGEPGGVLRAPGSTVQFTVQRITTTNDLETALSVDVDGSYGAPSFGAGISARFAFAQQSKIQSSSLFMAVAATVQLQVLSIDTPVLTPDAAGMVDRPDVFPGRYGHVFVRSMTRGGLFVGVLRLDTADSTESEQIAAELNGSYGLFSADAQSRFESIAKNSRAEVFIQMYHEGGAGRP